MITITPHIEICDKWLEPSIANVSQKQQRKEIWKVANEYIDKTLTFQADARGKEIKRDLLGILQYRSCLIDFFGLPDPKSMSKEAKNQEKTKIKNVEYLFTCIRRGLAERAEEDQTGAYKFLTADDLEEWVEKFNVNPEVLRIFSFHTSAKGKRGKNVFLSKTLSDKDSERIWQGLIKYGFIAKCTLDDFRWWFNTPFPEYGINRTPLKWIGNNNYECCYFAKRLTQYVEENPNDDSTWIGYSIHWQAFITIFPNMKGGDNGTGTIRTLQNHLDKVEAKRAKLIDGIIGIMAPIRTKEELDKINLKYNSPKGKREKFT